MGYRVTDQRQTFQMSAGGKLAKVWELTVATDEGPDYTVDIPPQLYGDAKAVKDMLDARYADFQAIHSIRG